MIAITGATGFLGRGLVRRLAAAGKPMRCWYRSDKSRSFADSLNADIEWIRGDLAEPNSRELMRDCDAVVHGALWRPKKQFQAQDIDVVKFCQLNLLGSIDLIQTAAELGVNKFVFISTCAVHDQILDDRPLDEAHPLWPHSHYGAHKAAIEKFVHSFGLGSGFPVCAIRPTGIYGLADPIEDSKWYSLVADVKAGKDVTVNRGGKEVHVSDVAKAIELLLGSSDIAGQAYACCDRYISEYEVAHLAKEISGSNSQITGSPKTPKHEIDTSKLKSLGMEFGGETLLRQTVKDLIERG